MNYFFPMPIKMKTQWSDTPFKNKKHLEYYINSKKKIHILKFQYNNKLTNQNKFDARIVYKIKNLSRYYKQLL